VTQTKTISLASASAAGLSFSSAPAASRSATRSRLRCTVSDRAWLLASRFFAMPWPINPDAPMKPIAAMCCSSCVEFGRLWTRERARPIGADDRPQAEAYAALAQPTICAACTAPDFRLTSRPWSSLTIVGMLRMAKRDETSGLASLSTLASTACPLS
jgi:hypothetical protein